MNELERLQSQAFIAKNRIAELQAQLAAEQDRNRRLSERLHLSQSERQVLAGREDGCVRVGDLRPILDRVFGDAA